MYDEEDKFLLYGGTPEIRSLFQKQNLNVTLIDRSKEVVYAMGLLTACGNPLSNNETFIQTDWLSNHIPNQYDFIIGDDAINMVEWSNFELFLENTHRMLKDNGVFVCHLLVKPDDELINKQLSDVVIEYEQGKIKSHFDLASRLNFICYDNKAYAMGWQRTINMIGKEQLNVFKPRFDFVNTFGFCNSQFYCPPQNEFEKILTNYFEIQEIFYLMSMTIVCLNLSMYLKK